MSPQRNTCRKKFCSALTARASLVVVLGLLTLMSGVQASAPRPPIRHVFELVLENQSYADTFGPHSLAPYLAKTLAGQGVLLQNYYGIGHASLDNYVAMISGQPPNEDTQEDCSVFREFVPRKPGLDSAGRALRLGVRLASPAPTMKNQML